MQRIFKAWMIGIFILALIASFLVDISSAFFGFLLLPILCVTSIFIVLGYYTKR